MKSIKKLFNHIFIDGFSGMAMGLFSTLIIGTILAQIASLLGNLAVGGYINAVATFAKIITGAGIGVGVASKFKASPLVAVSGAVCGMVGAHATSILSGTLSVSTPGEPLGAFVAAFAGIEIGMLVSGKTKLDIILTPFTTIAVGGAVGLLLGRPVSTLMAWLGGTVNAATVAQPVIMGIVIATLMGIFLTLPISSAAIGISIGLSGIAAGAAVVGCCCQMIGFAVISYRDNKFGGLVAQGIGTSMLQMPNIVKKPVIWLAPTLTSAILGPISTAVLKMECNAVGSGMGTSGLVGQFGTFDAMMATNHGVALTLVEIVIMHFIAPAVICLGINEGMRKLGWIKNGDMKISVA